MKFVRVARIAELKGDGPHAVAGEGADLVVVRTKSGLRAYEGRCPHQGALLGEGEFDGTELVCRNHRWRFDAATGQRAGGTACLKACPVEERDGALWADVSALGGAAAARGVRTVGDLPGPRGVPLLGNLLELKPDTLHQILEAWAREFGPVYRFRFGPKTVVAVADPAMIEDSMRRRPESFRRLGTIEPIFQELGVPGVFSSEGTEWRPQRRLAMEALSHKHLRGFFPTLRTVAEKLRRRWATRRPDDELEIVEDFKRFTIDVTTLLALGYDVNTLEREDDPIHRRIENIFPTFNRRMHALVPYWRLVRLPADRRVDRDLAELRDWLRPFIAAAREKFEADPSREPANFLEAMVTARDDEGKPFEDRIIFGNALQMLLAGEDTTANTLAWAVHELAERPDVVSTLRREVDSVLGDALVPPDVDSLNRLNYTGAVANETMRLRPVAPMNFMETVTDLVLGDVAIPKGTAVFNLMRAPTTDARAFGDPSVFRPERWLDAAATGGAHEPRAHMPFGSGPRICPGRSLALLELRLVLATLVKNFDITRAGRAEDVRERFAFTMEPLGVRVRLGERRKGEIGLDSLATRG